MKYLTLAAALAASMVLADAALARGRRGGCPGGNCSIAAGAPIQKELAAKEPSPSDAPQAAAAEGAQPQVVPASTSQQRTRRIAFARWRRGR